MSLGIPILVVVSLPTNCTDQKTLKFSGHWTHSHPSLCPGDLYKMCPFTPIPLPPPWSSPVPTPQSHFPSLLSGPYLLGKDGSDSLKDVSRMLLSTFQGLQVHYMAPLGPEQLCLSTLLMKLFPVLLLQSFECHWPPNAPCPSLPSSFAPAVPLFVWVPMASSFSLLALTSSHPASRLRLRSTSYGKPSRLFCIPSTPSWQGNFLCKVIF
jgi:hypothetical protein